MERSGALTSSREHHILTVRLRVCTGNRRFNLGLEEGKTVDQSIPHKAVTSPNLLREQCLQMLKNGQFCTKKNTGQKLHRRQEEKLRSLWSAGLCCGRRGPARRWPPPASPAPGLAECSAPEGQCLRSVRGPAPGVGGEAAAFASPASGRGGRHFARAEALRWGGNPSWRAAGCGPAAMPSSRLRVAVVCSSNQNRSMEAHNILSKRGFSVRSFGTGTHVKLPGPAPDKPNVYDFKTTYDQMYNDLLRKDKELYTQNGILHMLDRNKRIKPGPERFQNCKDLFDLILTCEERVYDQVVEDLNSREQDTCQPVHVVNVDIQDNQEEATLGAFLICELCQCIQHTEDMENEIDELLQEFEEKSGRNFLHTVCFY
ncbi:hypothetical protein H8959_013310 [Pygathrix nigripes]